MKVAGRRDPPDRASRDAFRYGPIRQHCRAWRQIDFAPGFDPGRALRRRNRCSRFAGGRGRIGHGPGPACLWRGHTAKRERSRWRLADQRSGCRRPVGAGRCVGFGEFRHRGPVVTGPGRFPWHNFRLHRRCFAAAAAHAAGNHALAANGRTIRGGGGRPSADHRGGQQSPNANRLPPARGLGPN